VQSTKTRSRFEFSETVAGSALGARLLITEEV
jgi:hypothetical protein